MLNSQIELTMPSCRWNTSDYQCARWNTRPIAGQVLLNLLPNIVADLLPSPETLCLYNEQYIVKPPCTSYGSTFVWHQDSEYLHDTARRIPTIACWIPLDDVDQTNGTVQIEPYPKMSDEHSSDLQLSNLRNIQHYITWHNRQSSMYATCNVYPTPGMTNNSTITVSLPAGSILLMSDRVRHCSQGNASQRTRRVFMAQYSSGIVPAEHTNNNNNSNNTGIDNSINTEPIALAVPVELSQSEQFC
ncbi:hypothetical protein BDF19DRAFT_19669 [Syncephalis fuscata]|nr:hypothetical protein BDF19DRAFT_19669 [Syncephalis fuscata]